MKRGIQKGPLVQPPKGYYSLWRLLFLVDTEDNHLTAYG
jgi:hypothetical protein